jgi:acetyl-CoA carboxylase carboxyltransferase component
MQPSIHVFAEREEAEEEGEEEEEKKSKKKKKREKRKKIHRLLSQAPSWVSHSQPRAIRVPNALHQPFQPSSS